MSELERAIEAQRELAERRASYARNPRENATARDARDSTLRRLKEIRDKAAQATGVTPVQLDQILYGREADHVQTQEE